MGTMNVLGRSGDTEVKWDRDNSRDVRTAREAFEKGVAEGMTPFRMRRDGAKAERMEEFDPLAERIVLVPRISGG